MSVPPEKRFPINVIFVWDVTDNGVGLVILQLSNLSTDAPTIVNLGRSYNSLVSVVSLNYDRTQPPLATRVSNVQSDRFDLQLQRLDGSSTPVSGITAHIVAVEEGVYNLTDHGVKMEAVKFTSTVTDDASANWFGQSRTYLNSYTSPVVLGQLMSSNNPRWSIFWASNGSRSSPPSASSLYVGKHVAEDTIATRANETIGYIVIEKGSGIIDGISYEAAVGSDTVRGMDNAPPYTYSLSGNLPAADVAIVSSAAIDGNNGGWPVLYGASPITPTALQVAYEEDQFKDIERKHTKEQVAYIVFGGFVGPSAARTAAPAVTVAVSPAILIQLDAAEDRVALLFMGPVEPEGLGYRILESLDLEIWTDHTDRFQLIERKVDTNAESPTVTLRWEGPIESSGRAFFSIELGPIPTE